MNLTIAQLSIINDYARDREFSVAECVSPEGHVVPTQYYVTDGGFKTIRCANLVTAVRTIVHCRKVSDRYYIVGFTGDWLRPNQYSVLNRMLDRLQ